MTDETPHLVDDVRSWGAGRYAVITWTCTCGYKPRRVMHPSESKSGHQLLRESHFNHVTRERRKTTTL